VYPSIENFVGNTPLVRLKRIPGDTSNVLLAKLEGNNPAGSVKDRAALSMIVHAEQRGDIKPGDTLIEATSGNTGIALAMAGGDARLQDDFSDAGESEHGTSTNHACVRCGVGVDVEGRQHGAGT